MCVFVDKNEVGLYSEGVTKVVCNSVGENTAFGVANKCVKLHISVHQ